MNTSKTKSVLFVAMIACGLPIHAATNSADSVISNYHAQIAVLQASNDLDHAQLLAKDLVELVRNTYGARSTNYAQAISALGNVLYYRNDFPLHQCRTALLRSAVSQGENTRCRAS